MHTYKGVIVTDLDGTLLRYSMFLYLVDWLILHGYMSADCRKQIDDLQQLWSIRKTSYSTYLWKAIELFEAQLKGIPQSAFISACRHVTTTKRDEVYRYTKFTIEDKLAEGWFVAPISASPEIGVRMFAALWGMQASFGTHLPVDSNGCFTGERDLLDSEAKARAVDELLEMPSLQGIPRENIWGIGDTTGDIAMLERVGLPICMNADSGLTRIANERGWMRVIERKDVITVLRKGVYRDFCFGAPKGFDHEEHVARERTLLKDYLRVA